MELRTRDVTLHYRVLGEGEPVLLVHGFPLSGQLWEEVAASLATDHRVIVPDLRGHGSSEASERASMEAYALDLAAILESLGETRPVVFVGMSMGGYIAFEFLRGWPDRVRALVLTNTRTAADDEAQARGRREVAQRVRAEGSAAVADSLVGKLFAPVASAALRQRWHARMAATPPLGVAAALEAMAERPDSGGTLRAFAGPVLVVTGVDDTIISVDEARAMNEAAPRSRLALVEDAGHMTPVEQPERFVELVKGFLRGLDPLPDRTARGGPSPADFS